MLSLEWNFTLCSMFRPARDASHRQLQEFASVYWRKVSYGCYKYTKLHLKTRRFSFRSFRAYCLHPMQEIVTHFDTLPNNQTAIIFTE